GRTNMSHTLTKFVTIVMALVPVWGPAVAGAGGTPTTTYRAFASPQQESGPASGSTTSGQATLTFDAYLTTAKLDFTLVNLDPALITGFHIHCGLPGQLGPMIVNFADFGAFTDTFHDGQFSVTLTNDDIVVANWPPDLGSLPEGCASNVIQPGQSN